ncbi:MAG: hypothetical protein ACK4IX_00100 [Candidatus Sericytochromatia bacterium]
MKKKISFSSLSSVLLLSTILGLTSCINSLDTRSSDLNKNKDKDIIFDKSLIQKSNYQIKSLEPQMVNFESKVPVQNYSTTQNLPSGTYNQFNFRVSGNMKDSVKIPANGNFTMTIQSGNNFQIIDNDATDGSAIIQLPSGNFEGFTTVIKDSSGKQTGSITIEDELYYVKQEIKELESSNKGGPNNVTGDYWYQLKKRVFPTSQNWGNPNVDKHVFKFSNAGIKQLMFRWYNSNTLDYPIGTAEIGVTGGIIELPNVGKLEIPSGALTQNTIISMRQELQSYEILNYQFEPIVKDRDYISSVIKLEPINLELLQPAKIFTTTDSSRIGNNSSATVRWYKSINKIDWDSIEYTNIDAVLIDNDINVPAFINKFEYLSKQIPSFIKPNDNYRFILSEFENEGNFTVKSSPNNPVTGHFMILYNDSSYDTKANNIAKRAEKAYQYFISSNVSAPEPPLWYFNRIPIYITPYATIPQTVGSFLSGNSEIKVSSDISIEHELWHVFQNGFIPNLTRVSILKGGNLNLVKPPVTKYWIHEASAEHMGARAMKQSGYLDSYMKDAYIENLRSGLDAYLSTSESLPYSGSERWYPTVSYFTFLAHSTTGLGGDKIMTKIYDNQYFEKFHDYSLHSYLNDKFDIYPYDSNILENSLGVNASNTINNPSTNNFSLKSNSAKYYKIRSSDNLVKGADLKISVENLSGGNCSNTTKVKLLKYKDENPSDPKNYMELKDYLIFGKYLNFENYKKDFDNIVIIVSNTDGTVNDSYSCNYNIKVAVEKPCTSNYSVSASYIDDSAYVTVNGERVADFSYGQQTQMKNISDKFKFGKNEVNFYLYNDRGGFSYNFDFTEDGSSLFSDGRRDNGWGSINPNPFIIGLGLVKSLEVDCKK